MKRNMNEWKHQKKNMQEKPDKLGNQRERVEGDPDTSLSN